MNVLATALFVSSVVPLACAQEPDRKLQPLDAEARLELADGLREIMKLDQLHRRAVSWGTTDAEELARIAALDDDAQMKEAQRRWREGVRLPKEEVEALMRKQTELDRANFERLIGWVRRHGYPDPDRLGVEAPSPVPVLLHAQLEWYEPVVELLRAEALAGRMPPRQFAVVFDRKAQHAGRVQLYGTCQRFDAEANRVLPPEIEDIEATNAARAALGLPPLEEWIELDRR